MDIQKIDKNFAALTVQEGGVEWFDPLEKPFETNGVFFDGKQYLRMSESAAQKVSPDVYGLNHSTAGGRVRFSTNSPYIALKCVEPSGMFMQHMPFFGTHGFSVYIGGVYEGCVCFPRTLTVLEDKQLVFSGVCYAKHRAHKPGDMRDVCVHFPLYNGVFRVLVGVKKGSQLSAPKPFAVQDPVVFYGSSITQGGCASHAGNEYTAAACRDLNVDHINLGFSGNAKGEIAMAKYIAGLKMSAFVFDYDYNAPSVEELKKTHKPFYREIRAAHPDLPVLFMTIPNFDYDPSAPLRRQVVLETFLDAKSRGENVWFIDGETFYGAENRDACAVDTCHPNDLGFYQMARAVKPVLKEMLGLD